MEMRKWNFWKKEYEPYEVPDEWNCKVYSDDMDEIVNCPHCGMELKFGDTYTSREIHAGGVCGYGVCLECYRQEWRREQNANGTAITRSNA